MPAREAFQNGVGGARLGVKWNPQVTALGLVTPLTQGVYYRGNRNISESSQTKRNLNTDMVTIPSFRLTSISTFGRGTTQELHDGFQSIGVALSHLARSFDSRAWRGGSC